MTEKKENGPSFEKSVERLEEILEKMNSGAIQLEEALKLYEEADTLIASCNKRLNEAERKIEVLVKNRSGEIALDKDGKPEKEPFSPPGERK